MAEDEPVPDDETLQHLQTLLLGAVLRGEPLPGSDQPVSFPDLSFILRQPAVLLSSENLAGPVSVPGLSSPLRVLDPEELTAESGERGEAAYLRFQPATQAGDTVRLTLEARIAIADPGQTPLGLSAIQAAFEPSGDGWRVANPPAAFAV